MELSSTGRPIRVLLRVPRFVIFGVGEQIYRVAWSPDGTWLALGSLKGLYVARSNGTGLRLRVSGHAAGAEGITWSPDGKTIVIHYGNGLLAVPFPKGCCVSYRSTAPVLPGDDEKVEARATWRLKVS